jgi:plastocyanin
MCSCSTGRYRSRRKEFTVMRELIPITLATLIGVSARVWATVGENSAVARTGKMVRVLQKNLTFRPTDLILKPDDLVAWTQQGKGRHDAQRRPRQPSRDRLVGHAARADLRPEVRQARGMGHHLPLAPRHAHDDPCAGQGKEGLPPVAYAPQTPTLLANPTPPQGIVPGVTGLPIAQLRLPPEHRTR